MIADAGSTTYRAYESLQEAQADPHGVVVMEGDFGGQIYLVVPARLVKCSELQLRALLTFLDDAQWADPEGAQVFFESKEIGQDISGGMGGGAVMDGIWLHSRVQKHAFLVEAILSGTRSLP